MTASTGVNTKIRKKRPEQTGTLVGVRLQPELLSALDAYASHAHTNPNRPETVRRILRDWLMANGYLRAGHVADAEALRPDEGQGITNNFGGGRQDEPDNAGLRPDQLTTENDG